MSQEKPEFEDREVEVSEVSDIAPASPKESEFTEIEEETKLEDNEKELGKSITKGEIAKGLLFRNAYSFKARGPRSRECRSR